MMCCSVTGTACSCRSCCIHAPDTVRTAVLRLHVMIPQLNPRQVRPCAQAVILSLHFSCSSLRASAHTLLVSMFCLPCQPVRLCPFCSTRCTSALLPAVLLSLPSVLLVFCTYASADISMKHYTKEDP